MPQHFLPALNRFETRLLQWLCLDQIKTGLIRHQTFLIYLTVIAMLCYAYELFSFSLHMDSEMHALDYEPADDWIAQGRWGLYLLNTLLLPNTVMPVVPMMLAIIGLVLGTFFFVLTLSTKRSSADYLAAPIAITCPVLYFALYYTILSYGIGIGFAFAGFGLYALSRLSRQGFIVAIFCFAFSIGIYQAFLPLLAVMCCFSLVACVTNYSNLSTGAYGKQIGIYIAALILACLLYALVTRLSLTASGIAYGSHYLSGFVTFSPSFAYLSTALPQSLLTLLPYYTGGQEYYLYDLTILKALFLLSLSTCIWRISRTHSGLPVRMIGLLILFAALLAPMSMLLMNSGYMPPRTLLSVVCVLAGLVFISAHTSSNIVRLLISLLTISCIYYFIVINNRFALANQTAWLADREISVMIIERLDRLQQKMPVDPTRKRYPIEVVGIKKHPDIPMFEGREIIGSSFFSRSPVEITPRLTLLFRAMGNLDYRPSNSDEKLSVVEQAMKMPLWPHEGAVDIVNGVMVIKLSDYRPEQIPVQ